MSRTIRPITLALALVVLCSSAAYALPSAGRLTSEDVFAALWARVVAWFAAGAPASVGEKAGSSMSPNGLPQIEEGSLQVDNEAGSQMDPDGHK